MRQEDRRFVFTVAAAFVVVTGVLMWRGKPAIAMIPAGLAATLMLVSVLFPNSIPAIHRAWMAGAHAISRVTTPIVLGIVYYLVLTPTGLIRRSLGQSSLAPRRVGDSYWVRREVTARPPADMRRQF